MTTSYRNKAYLYLLGATAIWAAASSIIKFTLNGIDPIPFLAYRFAISAVISLFFFLLKIIKGKKFHYFRKHFKLALIYGILAVPLALGLLFFGLDNSTVLDLILLGTIGPLLVTAGGAVFFKDHITKKEKIGISIVLAGVFVNSFLPIFQDSSKLRLSANFLLFVYLLSDSSSVLIAKRAVKEKIKSSNLTNLAFILGALVFIPSAIISGGGSANLISEISQLPFKYHLGVWYMAILSGNLAYFMYVRGQRSIESSEATLFGYLQPVLSVPLAVFWLNEKLTIHFVIGAIFIAAGLYVAEKKNRSKSKAN